jgi:hypothetical protein
MEWNNDQDSTVSVPLLYIVDSTSERSLGIDKVDKAAGYNTGITLTLLCRGDDVGAQTHKSTRM